MLFKRLIFIILLSFYSIIIYAYDGGIPFIQHSDSTTTYKAYSIRIKDLNASGLSIIGVSKINSVKAPTLWAIADKDSVFTIFTEKWFGNNTKNLEYSLEKEDSIAIFTHAMGLCKKDSLLQNSSLYIGYQNTNKVSPYFSLPKLSEEPLVEYMVYDRILNSTARGMVESYLAIKYGISLNQEVPTNYIGAKGDIIWSGEENKSYKEDIAGIGRDDKTKLNKKRGSSINSPLSPVVSASEDLADGMYLLWSHNGKRPLERVWALSSTGNWEETQCNFQFKLGGEENLPILEKDEIYTMLVDTSGTSEFNSDATINYSAKYKDAENIVFTNVIIPTSQSHFTITKRKLTDEEKENPYQYIHVHPSPSIDGNIFVECSLWEITPIEVEIYNVIGLPIFKGEFSSSNYYNVKAVLPTAGTYVILVKIEESILTYKVIRR